MKSWHIPDLRSTRYSYKFREIRRDEEHIQVEQLLWDEPNQQMELLRLAPHIKMFIGIMGTINSGKNAISKILKENNVYIHTSHGEVLKVLRALGIPEYRDSLEGVGGYLAANWPVVWVNKIIDACNKSGAEIVAFDGVRFPSDVILSRLAADGDYQFHETCPGETCMDEGRAQFVLMDAYQETRIQRMSQRGRAGDVSDREGFLSQEFNEFKIFWLDKTMTMADVVIENNGSEQDLAGKVAEWWNELVSKL